MKHLREYVAAKRLIVLFSVMFALSGCGDAVPELQPGGGGNPHPAISVFSSAEVTQPAAGTTTNLTVRIQFSNAAPEAGSINVATVSDTARAGIHFTALNSDVNFNKGATSAQFVVEILDGEGDVNDTNFSVQLLGATNAELGSVTTQTVTILSNSDPVEPGEQANLNLPQSLSFRAPRAGRGSIDYPVVFTLDKPAPTSGSVTFKTVDGSAEAGVNFSAFETTVNVAAGARELLLEITLLEDANQTENLEFSLLAVTATNIELPVTRAVPITVLNVNGGAGAANPTISWPSVTELYEPTTATARNMLLLPLSAPAAQVGSVRLRTESASALAGQNFAAFDQVFDIQVGDTELMVPVDLLRTAHGLAEPVAFYLQISEAANVQMPNPRDLELTILPTSVEAPPAAELQLPNLVELPEPIEVNGDVTYTLWLPLSIPAPADGSVLVRSVDGTALRDYNYRPIDDQLINFSAGDEVIRVDVDILYDNLTVDGKEFTLEFTNADGVQLPESRSMTILIRPSGETLPTLEVPSEITFQRPDDGTQFVVSLVLPFDRAAILAGDINLVVNQGSAIEGRDFSGLVNQYSFAKHDDELAIPFTLVGSNYDENRQFTIVVERASNLQLGTSTEERTITVIIEPPAP